MAQQAERERRRGWLPWVAWLLVAVLFVAYNGTRRIPIGRMVLPSSQAIALSLSLVVAVSLLWMWARLGWRTIARHRGLTLPTSVLDRRPVRRVLWGLLALAVVGYLYARFVEPRWLVVRRIPLGRVHIPTVHQPPVRIAVLSDLHVDTDREPFTSLPEKVNALEPDVVLLLGDLLNSPAGLPVLQRTLAHLRAPAGKFAVQGNWETWYWSDLPLLRGTGFRWLHREVVDLQVRGQTIHVLGWPYEDGSRGGGAETMLAALPAQDWRIFAHHTPDLVMAVPSADLAVAGHTHGGQISVPFFGALVTLSEYGKRFERGLVEVGHTRLYVNPGIGVERAVPLRFGVRPEITLIVLGAKRDRPPVGSPE